MVKTTFTAINTARHGTPGTIWEKDFESSKDISHLPKVDEEIIVQFGEIPEQSSTFKVEKISKEFYLDYECITYYMKNIE
jgi:hypothetical protein